MKKRIILVLLTTVLLINLVPAYATNTIYTDVSNGHWAQGYIQKAAELGIMQGVGDGKFGLGTNVKRCEFAAMLTRLFKWQSLTPTVPTFTDNADPTKWYYSGIETAVANGAVKPDKKTFRPEENITREEMAEMLVRALGYDTLADNVKAFGMPFSDVSQNVGYITIASDFGIITGKTSTTFAPKGYALREEAAAMIIRLYERYSSDLKWVHGFYAISSFSQKDVITKLNSISFGWSRMEYSAENGVALNTSSDGGNELNIPAGFVTPVNLAKSSGVATNLNVYMSASQAVAMPDGSKSNPSSEILLNADRRTQAVSAIVSEMTRTFAETGDNIYSGVTIDFEGMKGSELKDGFNLFLQELRTGLNKTGKKLNVMVHPKWKNGMAYYDAYDYRTIGDTSDKVILMAHDYQANSMDSDTMSSGFTTTPVTPFDDVYYALKAITDKDTGVQDNSKIALAISFNSVGWTLQNDKVLNSSGMHPTQQDIYTRLMDSNTFMHYSNRYRNPYITYLDTKDNTTNIVWYEDSRSVNDKLALARMFGIQGVSFWRLGTIPAYDNPLIHYNVLNDVLK